MSFKFPRLTSCLSYLFEPTQVVHLMQLCLIYRGYIFVSVKCTYLRICFSEILFQRNVCISISVSLKYISISVSVKCISRFASLKCISRFVSLKCISRSVSLKCISRFVFIEMCFKFCFIVMYFKIYFTEMYFMI